MPEPSSWALRAIAIPLVIVLAGAFIAWRVVRAIRKYRAIPTYDEYVQANPAARTDTGTACRNCNSTRIDAKRVGHTPSAALFFHVCGSCGTTLFRSDASG